MDIKDILAQLVSVSGVSGAENEAAQKAAELAGEYGEVRIDEGSHNVFVKRTGFDDSKPTVLLDAHIDEIGMIVTYITDDGFLKVSGCGGLDNRVLLAQQVTVCGKKKLTGFVTSTPPHLEKDSSKAPDIGEIYIDIGFTSKAEAAEYVSLGDRVLIENQLAELINGRVTSKAIDDRAGCAAVLRTLDLLIGKKLGCNVAAVFSSQEEVGERGAKTAAFDIDPDMAMIVDVSFAKTHSESDEDCGIMGKGPMIGIAPSLSSKMSDELIKIAEETAISYQIEVMSGRTGTNADAIGLTKGGVAAVTVSIPEKHMHTPVEIVDIADIENTAKLMAEYLERV